jgi:hypothetical protein
LAEQIAMIRDLSHADEDFEREEADRARDQSGRRDSRRDQSSDPRDNRRDDRRRGDSRHSRRDGRPDKNSPGKYEKNSASQSEKGRAKSSGTSSTYQQATRGVDSEVIAARCKNGDCFKCGKSGHSWHDCWAKEPNRSAGSDKSKRNNDS